MKKFKKDFVYFIVMLLVSIMFITAASLFLDSPTPEVGSYYTVQPGDTLWDIASRHWDGNISEGVYWIQKLNNLDSTVIHEGMAIAIPKEEK